MFNFFVAVFDDIVVGPMQNFLLKFEIFCLGFFLLNKLPTKADEPLSSRYLSPNYYIQVRFSYNMLFLNSLDKADGIEGVSTHR